MKLFVRLGDYLIAALLFSLVAWSRGVVPALFVLFLLGALTMPRTYASTVGRTYAAAGDGHGRLFVATLILPRILDRVIEAYKTRLFLLKKFAWDVSPDKVKFEQEIIAQMPVIPTAVDHAPGDDLTTSAQNVKDLIGDIPMKIDKAKRVVLKLPTSDAVRLELDMVFDKAVMNAGYALAEGIVNAAVNVAVEANFSHEIVEAAADVDRDTLSKVRVQLNHQKALAPRFGLTSLEFMASLTGDPRIASGDYHAKLVKDNPYVTLENLEGFESISEFSGFPVNGEIGTVVADATANTLTLVRHGLVDGSRVQFTTSAADLPAGLSASTDYYVRDVTLDTFKVAATLGGAVVDITDAGTGTHKVVRYELLHAFFFDAQAILIAVRQLNDNVDTAKRLGIPMPMMVEKKTDPETGLTFTAYMWLEKTTHDIYVAVVVAFGIRGGRQNGAADSLLDRSGVRVVTA